MRDRRIGGGWVRAGARASAILILAMLPSTAGARPLHRHAASRYDQPTWTPGAIEPITWAMPAPARASNARYLPPAPSGDYDDPGPQALHLDVNGARIKVHGSGLRMRMPIG